MVWPTALTSLWAEVDLQDGGGYTALTVAAYYDHPVVVLQLLRAGADMALRTAAGKTALQMAKEKGHTECVAAVRTYLGEVAAARSKAAAVEAGGAGAGGAPAGEAAAGASAAASALIGEGGAEAIRNHVARNVRLVNVPPKRYRMVPCAPGDTLERGLANQLDKDFVFLKMLEAAGIDASFALVRGRGMGGLPEEVPSLQAFNRSAVYLAGEKRFAPYVRVYLKGNPLSDAGKKQVEELKELKVRLRDL